MPTGADQSGSASSPSSVANKILDMKKHQVSLGAEVSISVEARPVHMLLPKVVEVRRRGGLNFSALPRSVLTLPVRPAGRL